MQSKLNALIGRDTANVVDLRIMSRYEVSN